MQTSQKFLQTFFYKNALLLFVILLALGVFLPNLGSQGYSLDEPQTVVVTKTILSHGYPSAWDGQIFLGGQNNIFTTVVHGIYFWTWYPWLQFYVIALFYYFFGNDIGMLRFPFAVFGVATVVMMYLITCDLFRKKWLATLISIHLIFLMPFFLYIRQVHYYSPSAFFSVLLFWLLLKLIADKFTKIHVILFSLASFLLFMTNSLIWVGCLPAFVFFCLLRTYKRHAGNISLWKFIFLSIYENKTISFTIFFEMLFALLWFHIFAPFGGKNPVLAYADGRPFFVLGIIKFLSYGNNYVFPLILFPFTIFAAWKLKKLSYLWLIVFWIGIKLIIYSLLIIPHGRFMTDIMPISMLFFAFIYYYLSLRKQILIIFLLFCVTITTNILSLAPASLWSSHPLSFRFYPSEFAIELTGEFPPAYLQVSNYLAKQAKPGDLFWSNYDLFEMYLYSDIPPFLPAVCPTNLLQKKIRWYIFYKEGAESLDKEACFGPKWQNYMEQNYVKKIFPLKQNSYGINDPDIVNRQFPPFKIPTNSIILYEKK